MWFHFSLTKDVVHKKPACVFVFKFVELVVENRLLGRFVAVNEYKSTVGFIFEYALQNGHHGRNAASGCKGCIVALSACVRYKGETAFGQTYFDDIAYVQVFICKMRKRSGLYAFYGDAKFVASGCRTNRVSPTDLLAIVHELECHVLTGSKIVKLL